MGIEINASQTDEKDLEESNSINKYHIDKQINQIKDNSQQQNVQNLEYKYIYFIVNFEKSKKIKIYLSSEYQGADTLEKVQEIINDSSSSIIYRFKIIPEFLKKDDKNKKYQIVVIAEEENINENKYKHIIKFDDIEKDYYEYNFKIKELDILPLKYETQFELYLQLLRKKYNKVKNSKENDDLILSTQLLIIEPNNKINFLFYIIIFLECYDTKLAHRHLILFNPERFDSIGKISNEKLEQITKQLDFIFENQEIIKIENKDERIKSLQLFYSMLFYFNFHFNKDTADEIKRNKSILIRHKNDVIKLFKKSKTFNQILIALSGFNKDIIQFLNFIYEEREFISKILEEEEEWEEKQIKNFNFIELEIFVETKKEDDINELYLSIKKILEYQNLNIKLVNFSPSIFEKYIEYYDEKDLNNLILLKRIIKIIRKNQYYFKTKYKIDILIHENILNFVKNKKLKNNELLYFIQNDDFYQIKQYDKAIYRPLKILDGIEISSLNDDFFNKWKNMNFDIIFKSQKVKFYKKISLFIDEMKDFSLLFSFYQISIENGYSYDAIMYMQNRFVEIFNTYTDEKCPNFQKDIIKLIYLSDKKDVKIKKFLVDFLENNLDVEKVSKIYLELIYEHQDLSTDLKKIIIDFIIKNNINPSKLYLAKILIKLKIINGHGIDELIKEKLI